MEFLRLAQRIVSARAYSLVEHLADRDGRRLLVAGHERRRFAAVRLQLGDRLLDGFSSSLLLF